MKANIKTIRNRRRRSNAMAVLFLAILFNCNYIKAQTAKNFSTSQPFSFEENKGQLKDEAGKIESDIKYYGKQGGVYVYCKPGMLSFVFTKVKKGNEQISEASGEPVGVQNPEPLHGKQRSSLSALRSSISSSRMDLVLIGSNPNSEITASDQQEYFENYYTTGDANKGITNVHTYKTVTYRYIYPCIDMLLNANDKGMEYSFLVHPGGNVNDIQLRWDGTEKTKTLKNGGIRFSNSIGEMDQSAPKSFAEGKLIRSQIQNKGYQFGFRVDKYNKKRDLLIDPTLMWGRYIGGNGDDSITRMEIDGSGNIIVTGITTSTTGLATSGAYQTSNMNNTDVFLAKLNSDGEISWVTYFGGSSREYSSGMSIDEDGNSYVTGQTISTSGIATSGAYLTSDAGSNWIGYLARFNGSGGLSWSTYFGGGSYSYGAGVSCDKKGNVYLTGSTTSAGIATSGAHQTSISPGSQHAYLSKFDSLGNLLWATYFGGDKYEAGITVASDSSGNATIAGLTQSTTGLATSGAYQTTLYDTHGTYLARFNPAGNLSWATYFGASSTDQAADLSTDKQGNLYIVGSAANDTGIITSGTYKTYISGFYDAFLAKFDSGGNFSWATYYGGNAYDFGRSVKTDVNGNIYIAGESESSDTLSIPRSYQRTNGGGRDAFLAEFSSSGNLSWATYFGGSQDDYGNAVAIDNDNNVYLAGATGNTENIATYSPEHTRYTGYWNDGFILKFSSKKYPNDAGIVSTFDSATFCAKRDIFVKLKNYGSDTLDSVKIGWSLNHIFQKEYTWKGSLKADSVIKVNIGNYAINERSDTLIIWTSKPNGKFDSIPENDTGVVVFGPKPSAGKNYTTCSGYAVYLGKDSVVGHTYSWTSNPPGYTSTSYHPIVTPLVSTTYYLTETVTSSGCSQTDSVKIQIPNVVQAAFSYSHVCFGDSMTFTDTSIGAQSYYWYFTDQFTYSSLPNPKHLFLKKGIYTVYETVTSASGCESTIHKDIAIFPKPNANFYTITRCLGDSAHFYNLDTPINSYKWKFGDGQTSTLKDPRNMYLNNGTYTVTLIDSNSPGCVDSVSHTISITPCVWPGDANYDKVVDMNDVLAIGVAYNDTGSARQDTSTYWYSHPCNDWSNQFKSGANHKHADCTGDGHVDSLDLWAIMKNYSKTHVKNGGSITSGSPSDPPLYLSVSKDSASTSDTISIAVNLGTSAKPLTNVYGLCFSITYDPVNVGHAKSFKADLSKCWLGTFNKNLIYLVHNDSVNGKMDIGITRTDHKNISGYGSIGNLSIIMPDDVGGKKFLRKELRFGLENVRSIDNIEDDKSLYTMGDSILFYGFSNINEFTNLTDNDIQLYPNPAHSSLQIDAGKDFISEIEVSDILGRNVLSLKYNHDQKAGLNINNLAPGTYYIYIRTYHGFARSRFVKD